MLVISVTIKLPYNPTYLCKLISKENKYLSYLSIPPKKNHFEDYLPMAVSLCCDLGNCNPAERRPYIIMTSLPLCSVDPDAIIMKSNKTSVLICSYLSLLVPER